MNKEKIISELKALRWQNFLLLLVSGFINSIGVTLFLAPVSLYDSGISGTSMILAQVTPEWMSLSLFLVVLNLPLFLLGLKKQGLSFTVYSLFAVAVYSLGAFFFNDILPIDVSSASPFAGKDLLLCAIFGGLISGVGSGMTIRYGGAFDGYECMVVLFSKKLGLSVGTFVMIYNVLLYIIVGIVFDSWALPLYSIIAYAAAIKTVDFMVEGIDRSKGVMIITEKQEDVTTALTLAFERGVTVLEGMGGYSGDKKAVIYFVVNRFQVAKMRNIIHAIDPKAYMTISEVADVYKGSDK